MTVTAYAALLISNKPSAQQLMSIFLKEAGLSAFSIAGSLREAVQRACVELPHVIIVQEDLADASATQIVDAIRKQPNLEKVLIFVMKQCNQDEILQFMKLRVSAIVSKGVDPNAFIEKVRQKLGQLHGLSPYGFRGEELPGGESITIRVQVKIVGRYDEHVVCRSTVEANAGVMVSISPDSPGLDAFAVTFSGAGMGSGESHENLFSLNQVVGRGRQWLMTALQQIEDDSRVEKRLLIYEKDPERIGPLQQMLQVHGIATEYADSVNALALRYKVDGDCFGAVYFCETLTGPNASVWEKMKKDLPGPSQPVEIMVTSSEQKSTEGAVIWLRKPFGIDQIVQSYRTAVASRHRVVDSPGTANKQVSASYILQGKIVAIDEMGGILQARVRPMVGTELVLDHPFLNRLSQFAKVRVTQVDDHAVTPEFFLIRFQILDSGFVKDKFYVQLLKSVDNAKSGGILENHAPLVKNFREALRDSSQLKTQIKTSTQVKKLTK